MNHSNHTKGFLYAALGSLSWGISGVCSQSLFMHYQLEASWLTAVRMVCSGILLLLITLPKDKANVFRIWTRPKDVIQLLAFALLGLLMCQYTFLCAIRYSNSATATVLQSLNVILMAVIMGNPESEENGKSPAACRFSGIGRHFSHRCRGQSCQHESLRGGPDLRPSGRNRRYYLHPFITACCGRLGKSHGYWLGNAHRRPDTFSGHKSLAASLRPGRYGLAPCGIHCPHRNSPWLLHFSGGRQAHRPRKGNPHRLSGTCLRHGTFRPVSGNSLFPAGA